MLFRDTIDDEDLMDDAQTENISKLLTDVEEALKQPEKFNRFAEADALVAQWEQEAKERLENNVKLRIETPRYALVDGEKVVISILQDGKKVYAAGDADGNPLVVEGRQGVIDPFSGRLRFRMKHAQVMNPAAVAFDGSNGLEFAQKALEVLEPGFMAFVKAVKPVKDLYRVYTRKERFKMKLAFLVASVAVVVRKTFKRKPKKETGFLFVDKIDIPLFHNKVIPTQQFEVENTNKLAIARFAAMRVPLAPDGSIPETYIRRWQRFLCDMNVKGIWRYGVLAPPSSLALPLSTTIETGLRYEKIVFTAFFTDQMPEDNFGSKAAADALNKKVGFDVFLSEGELPISSDWSKFPW